MRRSGSSRERGSVRSTGRDIHRRGLITDAGHKNSRLGAGAVGGAAAMNLLTAAHAMGYVGGWITGWRAYSPMVNAAFAGPGERIAGFVFIGSPGRDLDERPRPDAGADCKEVGATCRLTVFRAAVLEQHDTRTSHEEPVTFAFARRLRMRSSPANFVTATPSVGSRSCRGGAGQSADSGESLSGVSGRGAGDCASGSRPVRRSWRTGSASRW